jgi:hypothetical protein
MRTLTQFSNSVFRLKLYSFWKKMFSSANKQGYYFPTINSPLTFCITGD